MIPKSLGRKCAVSREKLGFEKFLAGQGTFYTSSNGNYMEGAGTVLSIDSLSDAQKIADEKVDADGDFILLPFNRILVPPALRVEAGNLYNSKNITITGSTAKTSVTDNPHAGTFVPISSPYCGTAGGLTGSSNTAWYLLPAMGDSMPIQVAYLNGVDTPTVEQGEVNFSQLGITWRVTYRFGFAKGNKRCVVKSKGAA
jgi:hypothetical protein